MCTRYIIQQKWLEGTTIENIGKFLQSWAPEPYRNKSMPKGRIQALLNITPKIIDGKHIWLHRDIRQKTTSQSSPDPYRMETLDGI